MTKPVQNRCKDCTHWPKLKRRYREIYHCEISDNQPLYCEIPGAFVRPDEFCGAGEWK